MAMDLYPGTVGRSTDPPVAVSGGENYVEQFSLLFGAELDHPRFGSTTVLVVLPARDSKSPRDLV